MEKLNDCPMCGGKMEMKKVPYSSAGVNIGEFNAETCTKCREVFFLEESSRMIEQKAKELGLWGLGRRIAIGKSGTSLIIRIPKIIVERYKIQNGGTALIFPEGKNRICLEV
jgi:hypothetical protein